MSMTSSSSVHPRRSPSADEAPEGAVSLQRRFVGGVGLVAVTLLVAAAAWSDSTISRSMLSESDDRMIDAAHRSVLLVDRVLAERRRQVEMLATSPTVIDAARRGGEVSRERTLQTLGLDSLERRFKSTRSQQVDARASAYLRGLLPKLDVAEVIITDDFGFNAVATSPPGDFVQSDEPWWQHAWNDGITTANATEDAATNQTVVEYAHVINAPARTRDSLVAVPRLGVVKVKFGLATLDTALIQASAGSTLRVDLVDSVGRLVASSGGGTRLHVLPNVETMLRSRTDTVLTFEGELSRQRGSAASLKSGPWRVIAHMDERAAMAAYESARTALLSGVFVALVVIVAGLVAVNRFIEQRISRPAYALAHVAEAVAAGDLSTEVVMLESEDEIGRLSRAVKAMVDELRRLASAMSAASHDTASMSAEITAGSEEMAAAAGEIATTASDLSRQAATMAQTIQSLATSSDELAKLAGELDQGSQEGVQRNAQLKALALDNRARLQESSVALEALAAEVQHGATAVDQLAEASIEVRTFVALVQKLARQSKLLALNAAMEAARAGEHGEGFAVVASEVRRLAAMSSEAAERTQTIVADVLRGIDSSRESSERMVSTVRAVRGATELGSRSFDEIEQAVNGSDQWTSAVERTAKTARSLADELRRRTESLASGTDSFAAAMQQVAASSEEQSASTEEIAGAAAALATAAERLSKLVANLRLEAPPETNPEEREPTFTATFPAIATAGA